MNAPLYVSFYTPDYAPEAAGLVRSLDRFDLPHDVRPIDTAGSWTLNCGMKPDFLLEMLGSHRRPLVWLDADARVRARPVVFESLDCDCAVTFRRGSEVVASTIYVSNSSGGRELLTRWSDAQRRRPETIDQRLLQDLVEQGRFRIERLPCSYARIFDADDMGAEVVIEQQQASRRLRRDMCC